MNVQPMRHLHLLAIPTALLYACDPQVDPDYQGEPLGTLMGNVVSEDSSTSGAEVAVLWFTATDDLECEGPVRECSYGFGGMEGSAFECAMACPEPAACEEDALATWESCVSECGRVVTVDSEVSFSLCASAAVGDKVAIEGQFPASFTLDLYDAPPDVALLQSPEGGQPAALGFFVVVEPDAALEFDESNLDDGRIIGGSETHVLLYAEEAIEADSPWGRYLGSGFPAGFHVLQVIDGGKECDLPGGECAYYTDTLVPASDNLETEIVLHLAPFDQVEWPALG